MESAEMPLVPSSSLSDPPPGPDPEVVARNKRLMEELEDSKVMMLQMETERTAAVAKRLAEQDEELKQIREVNKALRTALAQPCIKAFVSDDGSEGGDDG
ncbi:hypothetical protein MN608_04277 [Microdochium nivale]|nr:hypothetical protein MN608_04277 [Microdochium nivale]